MDDAKRLGVDKPAKYFKDLDASCIALDNCFVSRHVLDQLDVGVDEALKNEGWCEAEMLMPPDLPTSDAPALLALTATVKGGAGGKGGGGGGGGGGEAVGGAKLVGDMVGWCKLKAMLKAHGYSDSFKPIRVFDNLLSSFAFNSKLHPYNMAVVTGQFLEKAGGRARELGAEAGRVEGMRRLVAKQVVKAPPAAGGGGGGASGGAVGGGGGGGGGKGGGKGGGAGVAAEADDVSGKGGAKKGGGKKRGDESESEDEGNEFSIKAEDLEDSDEDGRGGKKGGKKGGKAGKGKAGKGGGGGAGGGGGGGGGGGAALAVTKGGKGGGGSSGGGVDDDKSLVGAPTPDDLAAVVSTMAPDASDAFCEAVGTNEKHYFPSQLNLSRSFPETP